MLGEKMVELVRFLEIQKKACDTGSLWRGIVKIGKIFKQKLMDKGISASNLAQENTFMSIV